MYAAAESEDAAPSTPAELIAALVREFKAKNATLLLCLSRGVVDAATFSTPPSSDAELPLIVQNMTRRQLPGLGDETPIDFLAYAPDELGTRTVTAMVLPPAEQQAVHDIAAKSGCRVAKALVITHPLRILAEAEDDSASLVVSKCAESAHILVVQDKLPLLSRTIRLAEGVKSVEEADFVATEIQRTLLSADALLAADLEVSHAVVLGAETEAASLVNALSERFGDEVDRVSVSSLIDGEAGKAAVGTYAPLLAAIKQEAAGTAPAIDFLNPRRPPDPANQRNRFLAIAAVVTLLVGGGWYYVNSQFAEIEESNAALRTKLKELNGLVKDTKPRRDLARYLRGWEASRMSWLDELRDITMRMPSSPDLSVSSLAASQSGRSARFSFGGGVATSPDTIRQMERSLRDSFHAPTTSGTRAISEGDKSKWTFKTEMTVKVRQKKDYTSRSEQDSREDKKPAATSSDKKAPRTKSSSSKSIDAKKAADAGKESA